MQLVLLLLLAGLGLAQEPTKMKISGAPSQSANLTNWVAGSHLPVTQTSEVKPVQKLAASQVLYSTPIIVGATSPEAAPWTITLGANTNTLTIRSNGGKILAVCTPTSCKEPQ